MAGRCSRRQPLSFCVRRLPILQLRLRLGLWRRCGRWRRLVTRFELRLGLRRRDAVRGLLLGLVRGLLRRFILVTDPVGAGAATAVPRARR